MKRKFSIFLQVHSSANLTQSDPTRPGDSYERHKQTLISLRSVLYERRVYTTPHYKYKGASSRHNSTGRPSSITLINTGPWVIVCARVWVRGWAIAPLLQLMRESDPSRSHGFAQSALSGPRSTRSKIATWQLQTDFILHAFSKRFPNRLEDGSSTRYTAS